MMYERSCCTGACTHGAGVLSAAAPVLQKYGPENAVVSLDKEGKIATLQSGQKIKYDALISTMPLDLTLQWLGKKEWADTLSRR